MSLVLLGELIRKVRVDRRGVESFQSFIGSGN